MCVEANEVLGFEETSEQDGNSTSVLRACNLTNDSDK